MTAEINTPEGRIDWPGFTRRSDFALNLPQSAQMRVAQKYQTGFDARLAQHLLFFTADLLSLHPLAFLVPASAIDLVAQDAIITLAGNRLGFSDAEGRVYSLKEAAQVSVGLISDGTFDAGVVKDNLWSLLSNLKLFGRGSIVLDLILGCNTEKNILSGAEALIFAPAPDLGVLARFLGAGEGLTPAFDDFLTGMLLVDRATGFNRISVPADFFSIAAARTTVQSLQQLQFAATGKLSLRFERFLADLLRRPIKAAEIVKIINFGHSSGTDILCGIWHYLNQLLSAA